MYSSDTLNVRFISWDIFRFGGSNNILPKLKLLQKLDGHLVALQLVTRSEYDAIEKSGLFSWSVFSLDRRKFLDDESKKRKLGTAIFGRPPFELKQAFLLDQAPWPERVLFAEVGSPAGPLTVSSAHIPNGSKHDMLKPRTFIALAEWLADHPKRMLVGIHTNAPEIDHPNLEQNKWYYDKGEPMMMGATPLHALKDALRLWLEDHTQEARKLYALRPQGPLIPSNYQGNKNTTRNAYRYDYVYISPDLAVSQVDYFYDEANQAGSDQAAVVADLVFKQKG